MIEFIYGLGVFLLDVAIWVLCMSLVVCFIIGIIAMVVLGLKIIKEEWKDGN